MPKAEPILIRSRGDALLVIHCGVSIGDRNPRLDECLQRACAAAQSAGAARAALAASVADMDPADPRHEAAYRTADSMRPAWELDIDHVCRAQASTVAGLVAKARLASSLIDRGEGDVAVGGPAMRVAASLVDDLLAAEWART